MTKEAQLRDYLKRVTVDLHTTRRKLRQLEARDQEPIAVVGMSCCSCPETCAIRTTSGTCWSPERTR